MEPPGADVCRRATPSDVQLTAGDSRAERRSVLVRPWSGLSWEELRTGAGAGAAALALSSTGEIVLLAVLLGAAAAERVVAAVAILATGAVAVRWGSTSLDAIAGAQAVLGPAAVVGPAAAAASAWLAGASLLLARAPGPAAAVFGVTAGLAVVGPGPGSKELIAMRIAAALAGATLAIAAERWAPAPSRPLALILATAALFLAAVA